MKREWRDVYRIIRMILICEILFALIWRMKEAKLTCVHEEGKYRMRSTITMRKS